MFTCNAAEALKAIEPFTTVSERVRFASSLAIDGNVGRAFRSLWSHRLGYATHMGNAEWAELKRISDALGLDTQF